MTINKEIMDSITNEGKVVWEEHTTTVEGIKVDCYKVEDDGVTYIMTKNDGEWVFMNVEA